MTTFQGILLISVLSLLSCGDESVIKEEISPREIITYVCHNPESIWHLSECNEQCLMRIMIMMLTVTDLFQSNVPAHQQISLGERAVSTTTEGQR